MLMQKYESFADTTGTWLAISYRLEDIRRAIPGRTTPREFCEEAQVLIEASLEIAGIGRSTGTQEMPADKSTGALWIGFTVSDAARAEAVIRDAVDGTSYGGFSAISRADRAAA